MVEVPPEFVRRMEGRLGSELPAFLEALREARTGLRVNSLRLSAEEFEKIAPFRIQCLDFPPGGYQLEPEAHAGRDPYHAAGLYYLQDPSAMAVGAVFGAQPGERVIDLAAAPGGKTTHIAAMMGNEGLLVANDVSRSRAVELAGNLERCGVTNAVVTVERVERLASALPGFFDRVLLDAPCSGEAMFGRSAAARADWSPAGVLGCAGRQADLLRDAARLVRRGGVLVYSTCTFSAEENERVIADFLRESPEFAPMAAEVPGAEAVPLDVQAVEWASDGRGGEVPPSRTGAAYRLWPHRSPGAGHFIAVLRRSGEERVDTPARRGRAPREAFEYLRSFLGDLYPGWAVDAGRLIERNGEIFLEPEQSPGFIGLDVLRPGLWLGTARRGRFEPAHALALALDPCLALRRLDLARADPRVERYLKGETIIEEGPPGWLVVTVDGFALGWGKRVGSVIKNHYPRGLRWR